MDDLAHRPAAVAIRRIELDSFRPATASRMRAGVAAICVIKERRSSEVKELLGRLNLPTG
jgi:hypothetical protein